MFKLFYIVTKRLRHISRGLIENNSFWGSDQFE